MANDYYNDSGAPSTGSQGSSATIRGEFDLIQQGFDKLPALVGGGGLPVFVNDSETALETLTAEEAKTKLGIGSNATWCGTATGTANALTLTPTVAITSYIAGQTFFFKSGAAPNSGVTTVSVSGLAAIAIQVNGAACSGGEIAANNWYAILVDASLLAVQIWKIGRATLAELGISVFAQTILDDADAAAARATLGAAASGTNNDITSLTAISSFVFEGTTVDDFETTVTAEDPTADNAILIPNKSGTLAVTSDIVPAVIVPVRQTVLSGPVDTSGYAAFGGSTGSTTVTASGILIPTAANGFNSSGGVNRIGSITNPSWTGLSTNGTMYLYLDIAADGTCTTGSTTLAPNYRSGGADVTTNGQFTFNIQEMVGKVGNGATATQTYRVFVGEVTVAGGVVTAITWYALMGRYESAIFAAAASTTYANNHKIGITQVSYDVFLADDSAGTNIRKAIATPLASVVNCGWYPGLSTRTSLNVITAVNIGTNTGGAAIAVGFYKLIANRGW